MLTKRIFAAILDLALMLTLWRVTIAIILPYESLKYQVDSIGGFEFLLYLFGPFYAFWFLLFPMTEYLLGGTVFKIIFQLRVVTESNEPPSFISIIKRRLADMVDFQFCGLVGLLIILNSPNKKRLGDLWAKTKVIRAKDLAVAEKSS